MKGALVKIDPAFVASRLREAQAAHDLLDQFDVPAGTLRERIDALSASFNTALQGHKDEILRLGGTL